MTENSTLALQFLRKTDNLHWLMLPLFLFVIYIYLQEFSHKRYDIILIGLYSFFSELIVEQINALIFHFTGYAPLWSIQFNTTYLLYIGYCFEIAVFFAIAGILFVKSIPFDRNKKILKIPNRIIISIIWGVMAFVIELILYKAGLLAWDYIWWIPCVPVIYGFNRLWIARIHDTYSINRKIMITVIVAVIALFNHIILVNLLKWI